MSLCRFGLGWGGAITLGCSLWATACDVARSNPSADPDASDFTASGGMTSGPGLKSEPTGGANSSGGSNDRGPSMDSVGGSSATTTGGSAGERPTGSESPLTIAAAGSTGSTTTVATAGTSNLIASEVLAGAAGLGNAVVETGPDFAGASGAGGVSGMGGAANVAGSAAMVTTPECFSSSRATTRSYAVGSVPVAIAVGDLTGNGRQDLAVANNGDSTLSVLSGYGDGSFSPAVNYPTGPYPSAVALVDLNGDAVMDEVDVTFTGEEFEYSTAGSYGGLTRVTRLNAETPVQVETIPTSIRPRFITSSDLDTDGQPDILMSALSGGISWLRTGEQKTLSWSAYGRVVGDVNHDGKLDVITSSRGSLDMCAGLVGCWTEVWLGQGDGTFRSASNLAMICNTPLGLGDFNGDGNLDIVEKNSILLGQGDGSFPTTVQGSATYTSIANSLAIADLDANGTSDIVIGGARGHASILYGKGDATFEPPVDYAIGAGPVTVALADINHDGRVDLLATASEAVGAVTVMLNGCR